MKENAYLGNKYTVYHTGFPAYRPFEFLELLEFKNMQLSLDRL